MDYDEMTLGKRQELFAKLLPRLLDYIHEQGYRVRIGDVFRDPRVHGEWGEKKGYSAAYSVHKLKLAVDLNLFDKDGNYLTDTESHYQFGRYWESLHPLCRWGGSFTPADGNHYSLVYKGYK